MKSDSTEQVARIRQMEQLLGQATSAVRTLAAAIEQYEQAGEAIRQLRDYYDSPLWRRDFEADEAGLLPPTLQRGVLSEDAVWNLLAESKELDARLQQSTD